MVPGREPYPHRLPPESEGDGYRMQHALAAALGNQDEAVHPPLDSANCSEKRAANTVASSSRVIARFSEPPGGADW